MTTSAGREGDVFCWLVSTGLQGYRGITSIQHQTPAKKKPWEKPWGQSFFLYLFCGEYVAESSCGAEKLELEVNHGWTRINTDQRTRANREWPGRLPEAARRAKGDSNEGAQLNRQNTNLCAVRQKSDQGTIEQLRFKLTNDITNGFSDGIW